MCLYAVTLKASFHSVWLKNCKKSQTQGHFVDHMASNNANYHNHSEELIRQSNSHIVITPLAKPEFYSTTICREHFKRFDNGS